MVIFQFLPEDWLHCGLPGFVKFLLTPSRFDEDNLEGGVAHSTETGNAGQQSEGPSGADPVKKRLYVGATQTVS